MSTDSPKPFRILSIDGGGMRGIIPAHVLSLLEGKLRARTARPLARVTDYFDMFAGTSTGAILVAGLLYPNERGEPRYSCEELIDLYRKHGKTIFHRSWWKSLLPFGGFVNSKYSDHGLRQVMHEYFGDRTLKDLLKPCLFTAYEIETRSNFFFRQHRAKQQAHYDFAIEDVVQASSAAPVLFPVAEVRSCANRLYHFIDGGTFAYNPTLCVYAEARRLHPRLYAKHMLVLSLGTGIENTPYPYRKARNWGAIRWMRPMHQISTGGMAEAVDFQLRQLFLTCDNKNQYLRISPRLDDNPPTVLDDPGPENLASITHVAVELGNQYDRRLDRFAELLAAEHE